LGRNWGVIALLITIPLEALLLKITLHQTILRSLGLSAAANVVSAIFGVIAIILAGRYFYDHAFFCVSLSYVGTVIIEYLVLERLTRPAVAASRLLLFDLVANPRKLSWNRRSGFDLPVCPSLSHYSVVWVTTFPARVSPLLDGSPASPAEAAFYPSLSTKSSAC
jgi:hypothetical protein